MILATDNDVSWMDRLLSSASASTRRTSRVERPLTRVMAIATMITTTQDVTSMAAIVVRVPSKEARCPPYTAKRLVVKHAVIAESCSIFCLVIFHEVFTD